MKITDLPELSAADLALDDVVVVDHDTGNGIETRRMTVSDLLEGLNASCLFGLTDTVMISAIKNSRPHGICLGDTLTTAQGSAIAAGTFEGICLGDYWLKDGIHWRVCGFNYWYNRGEPLCRTPHVVIMPDENLYSTKMAASDSTDGGYVQATMYKSGLDGAKAKVESVFGAAHILEHEESLTDAASGGTVTSINRYNRKIELPSEYMIYGASIFSGLTNTTNSMFQLSTEQLPLFAVCSAFVLAKDSYWLRDIGNGSTYAYVDGRGAASIRPASMTCGVRPVFGLM